MKNKQIATLEAKPHYALLDGLRGAAALMVVWYHVQEGFAFAAATSGEGDGLIKLFNHGYLAVDFFFVLSGFVIAMPTMTASAWTLLWERKPCSRAASRRGLSCADGWCACTRCWCWERCWER